jgi:uncharacterized protein with HEPN domain
MLALSVIKAIEMVGEGASKTSAECRKECSQVPWTDIISMRNRLIHVYFDCDLDIVWDTLSDDLPSLIDTLKKIIDHHEIA